MKFQKAFVISYFEGANKDYYKNDPFAVAIGMMITKGDKFSLKFSPDNRSANYSEICFLENYGKNSDGWAKSPIFVNLDKPIFELSGKTIENFKGGVFILIVWIYMFIW